MHMCASGESEFNKDVPPIARLPAETARLERTIVDTAVRIKADLLKAHLSNSGLNSLARPASTTTTCTPMKVTAVINPDESCSLFAHLALGHPSIKILATASDRASRPRWDDRRDEAAKAGMVAWRGSRRKKEWSSSC